MPNLWIRRSMDDYDARYSSDSARFFCSHAAEPGGDELSLRQRRDRWQRVRRVDRNVRGAYGAAQNGLSKRCQLFKIMSQFEVPD